MENIDSLIRQEDMKNGKNADSLYRTRIAHERD